MFFNSSTPEALNALARRVDRAKVERFLEELLNLKFDDEQARSRFEKRFGDLMPTNTWFGVNRTMYSNSIGVSGPSKTENPNSVFLFTGPWGPSGKSPGVHFETLYRLRGLLAETWRAPTVLVRQICLVRTVGRYLDTDEEPRNVDRPGLLYEEDYWVKQEVSRVDAFTLVLLRAFNLVDLMRYCPNPSCPAPYFIAKKGRQKYCSEVCALPAQRQFKKSWWAEHGKEWREDRKAKQAQKSKRSVKKGGE